MQLNVTCSVAELIYRFAKKVPAIDNVSLYGLYATKSSSSQLPITDPLSSLGLV